MQSENVQQKCKANITDIVSFIYPRFAKFKERYGMSWYIVIRGERASVLA